MQVTFYDYNNYPSIECQDAVVDFLCEHMEEYGDPREDVRKALQYALKNSEDAGGFICIAADKEDIIGAVVVNRTGMEGYIPENILVYIAIHRDHRGEGFGRKLMTEVIEYADGAIALHVEPENPALFLYRNLGFENKYLEMRLKRKEQS